MTHTHHITDINVTSKSLNRHDALLHCEALGGFLAEPRTPQQAELLENVAELVYGNLQIKTWWLGLSDQGHEGRSGLGLEVTW